MSFFVRTSGFTRGFYRILYGVSIFVFVARFGVGRVGLGLGFRGLGV